MVVRKRKKVTKYRGHVTHGGGSRKKRRGAGSRGGRGRAGSGKRSGHKKNFFSALGKRGFVSRAVVSKRREKTINVGDFTLDQCAQWTEQQKAVREGNTFSIDLAAQGYQKLLGAGKTTLALHIIISSWSKQAEQKITSMGGTLTVSPPPKK